MLAAAGVETRVSREGDFTPTPALSRAILTYNDGRKDGLADGIIITPSHNPPRDGGFKYNPPHGGPADSDITDGIQARANELLRTRGGGHPAVVLGGAQRPRRRASTIFSRPTSRIWPA